MEKVKITMKKAELEKALGKFLDTIEDGLVKMIIKEDGMIFHHRWIDVEIKGNVSKIKKQIEITIKIAQLVNFYRNLKETQKDEITLTFTGKLYEKYIKVTKMQETF